jgi:single-stranded-DNA-specific exonuclease
MPTIRARPLTTPPFEHLQKEGLPPLLARIYAGRGITTRKEIGGEVEDLLPYESLRDCVAMADHLAHAIDLDARIRIVADYDCDGATACSVMLRALRAFGANVGYTVPNRQVHGYGLTPSIVQEVAALEEKPDYIITVDNGIASNAGIEEANRLGITVLVTDHHLPGDTLPPAQFLVNPNRPDCGFASKHMAGVGVAFYVMWALRDELKRRRQPGGDFDVFSLLPLVAVGTVADVVKLDRNNRILVEQGLAMIRRGRMPVGLATLIRVAEKDCSKLSTSDIGFAVGPRINAAGRLETMHAGIECLTQDDPKAVYSFSKELDFINRHRRDVEAGVVEAALGQLIDGLELSSDNYTIALHQENWHEGVIGIAAGRLKERYYRPTFIFTTNAAGELKGSGRSIPGFHLRDALDLISKRDPSIFLKFGGHAMAAGAALHPGKFEAFKTQFDAVARELMAPEVLEQVIETDGELTLNEMNLDTVGFIAPEVWGQGFLEPCFQGSFEVKSSRKIGAEGKHLSLVLLKDGVELKAVKFNYEGASLPARIEGVYKLAANTFRGNTTLQLMFDEIRVEAFAERAVA